MTPAKQKIVAQGKTVGLFPVCTLVLWLVCLLFTKEEFYTVMQSCGILFGVKSNNEPIGLIWLSVLVSETEIMAMQSGKN